ncbi:phosphodiester glycosidase family protein [Paenibacillus albidus]|uniref:phosphodiester glycosidase family protein n=1 Tax=Paenibacillus albidus TaxID=2041023 RepID=UPI001BEB0E0F|nr:phosphodiester glycosidase family protein [Paenibacillus albidus]MBT2291000.1 phosphodiester glycosidase family protein [Paenibacillus albidus]
MKKMPVQLVLAFILLVAGVSTGQSAAGAAAPKNAVYVDKNNHSYIPLRFLTDFAGIRSEWFPAEKRIQLEKADVSISLTLGQTTASVNGKKVTLTHPAFRDNGTTYVPLSLISQSLGVKLTWNKESSSLTLADGEAAATLPVLNGTLIQPTSPAVVSANQTYKVGGKSFRVQTVTVSLLHPKVNLDVILAGNTVGKVEALNSLAKRSGAVAAINGTFFDAYTKGSYKAPYGYIVSGGKMLKNSSGDRRAIFTLDRNNLADIIPGLDFTEHFNAGAIDSGLQAGPRLLVNGKVSLNVTAEGFKDPKILTGGGSRSALGLTRDHKLILLTSGGATIPQLAGIMKQAGAYQAMNLDGGASSGLYYNGKYLTAPGRLISNAIVVQTQ